MLRPRPAPHPIRCFIGPLKHFVKSPIQFLCFINSFRAKFTSWLKSRIISKCQCQAWPRWGVLHAKLIDVVVEHIKFQFLSSNVICRPLDIWFHVPLTGVYITCQRNRVLSETDQNQCLHQKVCSCGILISVLTFNWIGCKTLNVAKL